MKMKRISLLAAALLGATFMMAAPKATESTIKASDSRITYIGRTEVKGGDVSFDWTGTYLKVRFQGNALSFKVSDTKKNYYNVWLDGSMDQAPDKVVAAPKASRASRPSVSSSPTAISCRPTPRRKESLNMSATPTPAATARKARTQNASGRRPRTRT